MRHYVKKAEVNFVNLKQAKYIKTIAECGSITEAAKKLYVSQPSLSKMLLQIEADIELILFDFIIAEEGCRIKSFWKKCAGIRKFAFLRFKSCYKKRATPCGVTHFLLVGITGYSRQWRLGCSATQRRCLSVPALRTNFAKNRSSNGFLDARCLLKVQILLFD